MSEDVFTEVTNESWFGRIGNSFIGIIIGIILFIASFPLLFWNEGRAVERYKTLEEGKNAVICVDAATVNPENNGRLLHLSGDAVTADQISDKTFSVKANALRMSRTVLMYQWVEKVTTKTKKKLGGGKKKIKTYRYAKEWREKLISSSGFKKSEGHKNPGAMPFKSARWDAGKITLGAFVMPQKVIAEIDKWSKLQLTALPAKIPAGIDRLQMLDGGYYSGSEPGSPAIGDLKISYRIVKSPTPVSVIAQQEKDSLQPYQTKAGGEILEVATGLVSAANMFKQAHSANNTLTWILRLVGFIVMTVGIYMTLAPIAVVADILPILGNLVGFTLFLAAAAIAFALSLLTIAIAWLFYRPLLAIILLMIGGMIIFFFLRRRKGSGNIIAPNL